MHIHSPLYYSKLYRDFKAIDDLAYRAIVYFYESNEKAIEALEFVEYFDVLVAYTDALFECEEFQKHILMSDVVIETSIYHNVVWHRGEEVFQKMLFKKSVSLYLTKDYKSANYIIDELVRINPKEQVYQLSQKKYRRLMQKDILQEVRTFTIICFLVATVVTIIEIFVVRTFYVVYQQPVEWLRISLYGFGILGLLYRYYDHYRAMPCRWEDVENS